MQPPSTQKRRRKPSRLLRDMRYVYQTGESSEESEGQKKCRRHYTEHPGEFLNQLGQLEKALRAAKVPEGEKMDDVVAPVVVDEGEDRCVELAERLIKEAAGRKAS